MQKDVFFFIAARFEFFRAPLKLVDVSLEELKCTLLKEESSEAFFEQSIGKWYKRSRAESQTLSEDMRLCACKSSVAVRLQLLNRTSL